jgi:hypothetical protein
MVARQFFEVMNRGSEFLPARTRTPTEYPTSVLVAQVEIGVAILVRDLWTDDRGNRGARTRD